ncbi:MAG: hypothetical protein LIO85_00540 [Rikenellaceae bacterium]|nr:hypothetical protein [Rikenellaceae bacterium]
MEIERIRGVLYNPHVIGADYRFVYEELAITFVSGCTFKERAVGTVSDQPAPLKIRNMKLKTKARKRIIILSAIALLAGFAIYMAYKISPGVYVYAQKYKLDASDECVIAAVDTFFMQNKKYRLPEGSYLTEEQQEWDGYYYYIYFYVPEEKRYLNTWIRGSIDDKNQTTFALVAISENLEPYSWFLVNNELSRKENRRVKKLFEEQILKPIKEILTEMD